jgi:hypothetical protein
VEQASERIGENPAFFPMTRISDIDIDGRPRGYECTGYAYLETK